ncbi:MAG: hypothetical protein ACE5SW_11795 [Nitrososphaeraceae archaeon]
MNIDSKSKFLILYCTFAGFISAWAISGLLVIVDIASQSPIGSFFGVIGISLGFYDSANSQYIGFILHIATGTVAGNIFGQAALFWSKLYPNKLKKGFISGIIVGVSLWFVLFLPLATFIIQPKLDAFILSAPNQYVFAIANNFEGLYPLIVIGSLGFHVVYGILMGFIAWRILDIKVLTVK